MSFDSTISCNFVTIAKISEISCLDIDSLSILLLIYSMDFFNSSSAELRGMFQLRIVFFRQNDYQKEKKVFKGLSIRLSS